MRLLGNVLSSNVHFIRVAVCPRGRDLETDISPRQHTPSHESEPAPARTPAPAMAQPTNGSTYHTAYHWYWREYSRLWARRP